MDTAPRVLLFEAAPARAGVLDQRLRQRGYTPLRLGLEDALKPAASPTENDVAVVLVDADASHECGAQLTALLRRLMRQRVATVVCAGEDGARRAGGPLLEWLSADTSLDEIIGKVGTLARYAPLVRGLQRELGHLHKLGEQLNRHFGEIDQEMRLASRLQHDFLPREFPHVPPFDFEVFYRPASWVSGDMYDVFRIDEEHIGMFVADAMGHGVAAGLLTMFLRQALVAKRIAGQSYSIVAPAEALANLHACLVKQKLPGSQFVTAVYGIMDTRRRVITLARAGHPYPLHIRRDGSINELRVGGTLLGLPDVPTEFEEARLALDPGDKIVFYTDGLEDAILLVEPARPASAAEAGKLCRFTPLFQSWAGLAAADLVRSLGSYLDCREGSLHPADDMTMLVLQVGEAPSLIAAAESPLKK